MQNTLHGFPYWMNGFRLAAWAVCGLYATIPAYWLMVHPFTAHWRRARRKLTWLGPLWVLTWCLAWAVSWPWHGILLYRHAASLLAPLLLWPISLAMYIGGGLSLTLPRIIGKDEIEPDRPAVLATHGLHARMRHPIYLGHLCTMLGWAIGSGSLACFALLIFAVLSGACMIRFEERELQARFGNAWEEYRRRTPMLLPALRH